MLKPQATRVWVLLLVATIVLGGCGGWPAPAVTVTRQFTAVPPDAAGEPAITLPAPTVALTATLQPAATVTPTPMPAPPAATATPTAAPAAVSGQGATLTPQATAPQMPSPTPSSLPGVTGQVLPTGAPAAPGTQRYTVRAGDSLWQIARYFGLPIDVLASANGFDGGKVLREGMELVIPWSNVAGAARYGAGGPVVEGQGLHFVASITDRACWLFRDGERVARWPCSPGRPGSPSIPGNYTVKTKAPRAYNAAADFWMPFWLGVYDAGIYENGIHGVPYSAATGETRWHDLVGTPITYGCIMLDDRTAEALYDLASLGMPVTILP